MPLTSNSVKAYEVLGHWFAAHPHRDAALVRQLANLADSVALLVDDLDERVRDVQLSFHLHVLHWMPEWGFGGDERFALDLIWNYAQRLAQTAAAPEPEIVSVVTGLLDAMSLQEKRELGLFHLTREAAWHLWHEAKQTARRWLAARGVLEDATPLCLVCDQPLTGPEETQVHLACCELVDSAHR